MRSCPQHNLGRKRDPPCPRLPGQTNTTAHFSPGRECPPALRGLGALFSSWTGEQGGPPLALHHSLPPVSQPLVQAHIGVAGSSWAQVAEGRSDQGPWVSTSWGRPVPPSSLASRVTARLLADLDIYVILREPSSYPRVRDKKPRPQRSVPCPLSRCWLESPRASDQQPSFQDSCAATQLAQRPVKHRFHANTLLLFQDSSPQALGPPEASEVRREAGLPSGKTEKEEALGASPDLQVKTRPPGLPRFR